MLVQLLEGIVAGDNDDKRETRLDGWIRRAKNNPALAIVLLLGIIIGALASFTDSLKSLASLLKHDAPGVTTARPEIRVFQARPEEIQAGDAAQIEWNVRSADSVQIDGDIGKVPLSGSRRVAPSETTTYTLKASKGGLDITSATTIRVLPAPIFEGGLALNDVFVGDAGWKQPQDSVFRGSIGGGRFRMEWIENRSGQCVTRDLAIGANEDFSLQVKAQAVQPMDYYLGLCWGVSGGKANYMLYVDPRTSSPGIYFLMRNETWQQVVAVDGQAHPYGQSVNLLDPANVNRQFQSAAIHPGTAENVLAVVRRGDKLRIFVNSEYLNQATYPSEPVDRVGMFIAGQLAAEFRDFSVRVAR